VPITLSTGTGSAAFSVNIPQRVGVTIKASAGFGSISHNLNGYTISQSTNSQLSASAENLNASRSFIIQISTGTGSTTVDSSIVTSAG